MSWSQKHQDITALTSDILTDNNRWHLQGEDVMALALLLLISQLLITFISFPSRNSSWPLLATREGETVAPLELSSRRSLSPYLLAPENTFCCDPLRLVCKCKCASMPLIKLLYKCTIKQLPRLPTAPAAREARWL